MESVVYWIRLKTSVCIKTDGYVGVTNKYTKRIKEHFRNDGTCHHLYNAIAKYGVDNITHSVIFRGSREGCLQIEEYFRPKANIGWNILNGGGCSSGSNHPSYGKWVMTDKRKHHYETYQYKGPKHSEETKDYLRKINLGKKLSPETRLSISKALTGKKATPETCSKRSQSLKGHVCTEDTRAKISKANKGKKLTDAHKELLSKAHTGKSTGLSHASAIPVNVYEYKTNKLVAEKVCAAEYARQNGLSASCLSRTLTGDRQKPGSRSNIVQHKNLYITKWEDKDES